MTTTNKVALQLYRALHREAKRMNDYNFRSHAIRRVKAEFVKNKEMEGEEAIAAAMTGGKEQLEMLKRQAVLGKLYPSARSVME